MKTKWGSCNPAAGTIRLNTELAKKPKECLEHVVVHELVHLIERHHNERFFAIMDRHMPQWRLHRQELNSAPLANETWNYDFVHGRGSARICEQEQASGDLPALC